MDTSSSGSETQSREMATSFFSLCAIRQPRRCQAIRNPGDVGETEPLSSHNSTLQHKFSNLPEDGARMGIEAALKRVKDQTQAVTQAKRAPVPEAIFEASPPPSGRAVDTMSTFFDRPTKRIEIWTELKTRRRFV